MLLIRRYLNDSTLHSGAQIFVQGKVTQNKTGNTKSFLIKFLIQTSSQISFDVPEPNFLATNYSRGPRVDIFPIWSHSTPVQSEEDMWWPSVEMTCVPSECTCHQAVDPPPAPAARAQPELKVFASCFNSDLERRRKGRWMQ